VRLAKDRYFAALRAALRAGLRAFVATPAERLADLPKAFSQPSEYSFVEPMRLMVTVSPFVFAPKPAVNR